jgi:hypothetical protein
MNAAVTVHVMAPRCGGTGSSDGSADASRALRALGGDCIRSRGLDGFRPGSTRERPDAGAADAAAIRAAGILIAAPAGARVVVPDAAAGADCSGQRDQ